MREEQTLVQFFSGKKMLFQSSFILITVQPFFFGSAMSATLKLAG